jgi:hypothetical protein
MGSGIGSGVGESMIAGQGGALLLAMGTLQTACVMLKCVSFIGVERILQTFFRSLLIAAPLSTMGRPGTDLNGSNALYLKMECFAAASGMLQIPRKLLIVGLISVRICYTRLMLNRMAL